MPNRDPRQSDGGASAAADDLRRIWWRCAASAIALADRDARQSDSWTSPQPNLRGRGIWIQWWRHDACALAGAERHAWKPDGCACASADNI